MENRMTASANPGPLRRDETTVEETDETRAGQARASSLYRERSLNNGDTNGLSSPLSYSR